MKLLKILSLAGLASSLCFGGYKLTDLNLNKNYKFEVNSSAEQEDFITNEETNNAESDATNVEIGFSEQGDDLSINLENQPKTLEELENNVVEEDATPSTELNTESETENTVLSQEENTEIVAENNNIVTNPENASNNEENSDIIDNDLNVAPESNNDLITDELQEQDNTNSTESEDASTPEQQIVLTEAEFSEILAQYDELKEEIEELISETKNFVESKNFNENQLTDEQNLTIQTRTTELNLLISNLKDTLKEMTCMLNGDCASLDGDFKTEYYNEMIKLNNRISMLQSAISNTNPYIRFYQNPYSSLYGFSYYYAPQTEVTDNSENQENESSETENQENEEKPTTFNLPNNLDTYGPTRRNIDTFFNTALLDENGMYNNSFMPYGYNMPYNNFGYGMNYGFNNSNFMRQNYSNTEIDNVSATEQPTSENNAPEEIGKKKKRFGKNIDTYQTKSTSGNINSMTGMKVTDYLKEKWNKIFNKKETQKQVDNYVDNFIEEHEKSQEQTDDNSISTQASIQPTINKDEQTLYY